ncbi:MAG: circularly permuted type 2 ATP-grasp protein, partial [Halomonas sp.]
MNQVNWNNYACRDFYDELLAAPGKPRESAGELCNMLARFSAEELAERKTAADIAIRTMGITFTVYSEGAMIDRAWPFDIVPRIISANEWRKTEAGLKQRVQALNLFIDDLYHDQNVVKDKVLPAEVLAQSVNFRPQCVAVNPPHGVWAHICGSDLVRGGDGI